MTESKTVKAMIALGIVSSMLTTGTQVALAKQRPIAPPKAKSIELGYVKGITGEASLTVREKLVLAPDAQSLQFQDGKLSDTIEFFKSPRCYLHLRKDGLNNREVAYGQILKVSKIDNVYTKGATHVTFWFDGDKKISDLTCISNYNHTMNSEELKATLGNAFQISFSKSVEKDALFNIAPNKNAPVLSESAPVNAPTNSARLILSDS